MRALNRQEHDYQIPVKDAIWASDERFASSEESKVGDRSTRRRMAGQFWKALARTNGLENLNSSDMAVKTAQERRCGKRGRL